MQGSKLPSFFKAQTTKSFSFKPRYYDNRKERHEEIRKNKKKNIAFNKKHTKKTEKGGSIKIILLIIILSLLAYKFIIN